jgi:TonB-linked SusC/RagA family outer membrane protein
MIFKKLYQSRGFFLLVLLILGLRPMSVVAGNTSYPTSDKQEEMLIDVLKEMSERYHVFFTYETKLLKDVKVNFEFRDNESLEMAIERLLNETGFQYKAYGEKYMVIYADNARGRKAARKLGNKISQLERLESRENIVLQHNNRNPEKLFRSTIQSISELKTEFRVDGAVTNANGDPLIGVNVLVKGTNQGTVTDLNGRFAIDLVDGQQTLILSYVGFETEEIPVNGRSTLQIIMRESVTALKDVTVIATGFQTISKERATGSFGQATDAVLSRRPVDNIALALNGQMAGVVTDPTVGFQIRGRSTLSNSVADRSPLIVVDGFPIEGGFNTINPNDIKSVDVLKDAAATSIYGARASNGVIVITTKKPLSGKVNVQYSNFFRTGDYMDLDHYMNMIDSKTHIALEEQIYNNLKNTTFVRNPYLAATPRGLVNDHFTLIFDNFAGKISQEQVVAGRQKLLNQDYKDDYYQYVLRKPFSQQQNLMISGSTERNSFKFSILYDNDKTHLQRQNDDRYMLSFNNRYVISKAIAYNVSTNLTFRNQAFNGVNLTTARSVTSPWTRVFDESGNYARHYSSYYDPMIRILEPQLPYSMRYNFYEESLLRDNLLRTNDMRIQNDFEIKLADGLNIRPMFQYERNNFDDRSIYSPESYSVRQMANLIATLDTVSKKYVTQIPVGGVYRQNGRTERVSYKGRLQMDYTKVFGGKHEVALVAGGEIISGKTQVRPQELLLGYNLEGLNYSLFDFNAQRNTIWNENASSAIMAYEGVTFNPYNFSRQANVLNERYISGYFSGSYTLSGKYTASISARTDASNYVSRTNSERYSPFYSLGLRWNLKNESFLQQKEKIDRLALRLTYGATGNAAGKTSVLPFSVFSNVAPTAETGNLPQGAISGRINDALTWEKNYTTNLGLDFSVLNSKLFGTIDVYNRLAVDLIAAVQTSNVLWSVTSLSINSGKVLNRGIELSLGTNQKIAGAVDWKSNLVFDYNRNKVLEYNFRTTSLLNYVGSTTFVEGLPTDRIMVLKLAGTTAEGYLIQEKKNGELVVFNTSANNFAGSGSLGNTIPGIEQKDDDRIYYAGRSTPPSTLGFTNTFSWKGFTLMGVITGRMGHVVRRRDMAFLPSPGTVRYSATGYEHILSPLTAATTDIGFSIPTATNLAVVNLANSMYQFYGDRGTLQKASSIRLDDLYLEYALPSKLMNKAVPDISVFAQGRNLGLLWTNNEDGVDPEFLPETIKPFRTITFGLRVKF